ncbi:MAG: FapA family protein [bacterium]|nr:FapA family protein [bacterium]
MAKPDRPPLTKDELKSLDDFLSDQHTEDAVGIDLPNLRSSGRFVQPAIEIEEEIIEPEEIPEEEPENIIESQEAVEEEAEEEIFLVVAEADRVAEWAVSPRGARQYSWEKLTAKLTERGIFHGIRSQEEIESGLYPLKQLETDTITKVVVARGTPAIPAARQHYAFLISERKTKQDASGRLAKLALATDVLEKCISHKPMPTTRELPPGTMLVASGMDILTSVEQEGRPGKTVLRSAIAPGRATQEDIGCGPGVVYHADRNVYVATEWGYLAFQDNTLKVVSPIVVTEDELNLLLFDANPVFGKLSASDILEAVKKLGISNKIPEKGLETALKNGPGKPRVLRLMRGKAPVEGSSAKVELQMALGHIPGRIKDDGSIDFRDINHTPSISEGELVAVFRPTREGASGTSVFGGAVAPQVPPDGEPIPKPDETIRVEASDDGEIKYYSQASGTLTFADGKISIAPELKITGDVDYATGNIDFRGNVTVTGAVLGGFSLKCTGNLALSGLVENGAQVIVEGSMVCRGILGKETVVKAGEDLTAQFIQDARVTCGSKLTIGGYILNAKVQSGNEIEILGKGTKGGALGGQIFAKTRVRSSTLGNMHGASPKIAVGVDTLLDGKIAKCKAGIAVCSENHTKLTQYLNVYTPAEIQTLAKSKENDLESGIALKLMALMERKKILEEQLQNMTELKEGILLGSSVEVTGTLFEETEIFIGAAHARIHADYPAVKAVLHQGVVSLKKLG